MMIEQDVSVPLKKILVRILGLSFVLMIAALLPFFVIWRTFPVKDFGLMVIPVFLALVIAHEAIHAIGWKIAGDLRWSDFKFGVDWKTLSPYCHARVPMRASAYRIGTILPGIITGLLPTLMGTLIGDIALTFVGAVMVAGAVGDLYVLWIIRHVPVDTLVKDHPSNAGCLVLSNE